MEDSNKQQIGDGSDNYGKAATQAAKAAKNAGKELARETAKKGAEATANAAAASVKAGIEGGKAVAEIATGTAAGGPVGAIISAAWSLRHTLYKILVCICLALVFLIVVVTELPNVVANEAFGLDGQKPNTSVLIPNIFSDISDMITSVIVIGYDTSLTNVETQIINGGYDYELSMNSLINYAQNSAGYDTAYIMSAYSASMNQQGADRDDMVAKLNLVSSSMFPVTSVEKVNEVITPAIYYTYKPVTVTVVTRIVQTGTINGVDQYRYETTEKVYYVQDQLMSTNAEIEIDSYSAVPVLLPIYTNGVISGTRSAIYYQFSGTQTITPKKEIVKYLECTIHPFDNSVLPSAFGYDLNDNYNEFNRTYGEVIDGMTIAMKRTLYGAAGNDSTVSLTELEVQSFLDMQNCSEIRKNIVKSGLSLVGKVPYFWGGKSAAGWNDEWNTPKLVTTAGSTTSGTIRPFGLDCSGFTDWAYKTATGVSFYKGIQDQWDNSYTITADELLPGDLGFLMGDDGCTLNHVLIFAGYDERGDRMWIHSSDGAGVVFNTPSYESSLILRRVQGVNLDDMTVEII